MTEHRLLDLVDSRDFRTLFIDELGWGNPDQPDLALAVDDETFTLTQVAGYKGLRIWHCAEIPPRKTQRLIDVLVGKDNHERLVIFSNEQKQEWRWPRRAQLGSANAKLLVHEYLVGDRTTQLAERLHAIELDFDEDLPLVVLLDKMRDAFDKEAETASVAAARLMGTLYTELEAAKVDDHDATLLLARLLFLLFGDDAEMWKPAGLFEQYLREHTTSKTLHTDLQGLFEILDTPEHKRRHLAGSPYEQFRYINGGLYADVLAIKKFSPKFRDTLIEACEFDWSIISPAVFGSMFQTVKSKEARRHGGEHYTTEENILKTIRPLFLDEYRDRLTRAWDDKAHLTKLHNDLGRARYMDPACGCGNFLVVAYRELRAIELEILRRRRDLDMVDAASKKVERAQLSLDVTGDIQVTLDHFYGIEIEEWPARIAETALLLVDHLANQQMAVEFGVAPDRLPIAIAPTIRHGNALHEDWGSLLPASDDVIIFGNPPFNGGRTMSADQKLDLNRVWGKGMSPNFDYVTGWYKKSLDYYGNYCGRWAFVSTNSICQGEPTADLWQPILSSGWRCRYAHRSFLWTTEATGGAAVHVSIIGFDKNSTPRPQLWTYAEGGKGRPTVASVSGISPYLTPGPPVLVRSRRRPLSPVLAPTVFGSMANDGGHFFLDQTRYDSVQNDKVALEYIRKFIGARELMHDSARWCIWMPNCDASEVDSSLFLSEAIGNVRDYRLESKRVATQKLAATPHRFGEVRQPSTDYLAIPRHVGEHRRYFVATRFSSDVICGDANSLVPDPDGFLLGILSSSMFIAWMRAIGGRIKSDLRFSNTFTYNTFPMPAVTDRQRRSIAEAAAALVAAREAHPGMSLAKLYDPVAMPEDLVEAHNLLDRLIDKLFGRTVLSAVEDRQEVLFRSYASLTGQEALL
ncbi:class I SAM-dependent DNA methyltransferase [Rhodococcus erythropolis]|uniref:class I SAM-dependent DNA methyltransferase n=1 Tax=Rhodococcus erythropolis TaxID=1833 RepID=UPI001C9AA484|nr:DNA methyltransferase [Rhodococcus erythropolis]MBY6382921.1 class I SAM-dependent DNA methyltransferase [Rhodococcus erythropolis]